MGPKPGVRPPFQFSLRALLLAALAFALSLQWCGFVWRWVHESGPAYDIAVVIAPLAVATVAYLIGQAGSGLVDSVPGRRVIRSALWVVLAGILAATCYAIWARYRWVNFLVFTGSKTWPYPDPALMRYHGWLDARNPPPPGCFKLHGEFFAVLNRLDQLALALIASAAAILGILAPKLPRHLVRVAGRLARRGRG
jgi:hypothetical protein